MFTQGFSVHYSPLNFLGNKTQGLITAIRHKDSQIVKKILAMGIHTGMQITLERKFPNFAIRSGQNRFYLNRDLASSIKVRVTTRH